MLALASSQKPAKPDQVKSPRWLHLALASGLGLLKPNQASQAILVASIGTENTLSMRVSWELNYFDVL
jgi:hypothetical protein